MTTNKSVGYCGVAFVVVALAAAFAAGAWPLPSNSADAIVSFGMTRSMLIALEAWLAVPGAALFLWFAIGVERLLAREGRGGAVLRWTFANAVLAAGIPMVTAIVQLAFALHPTVAPIAMNDLYNASLVIGLAPWGAWIFGVSIAARQTLVFPRWLGTLGVVAAIGVGLATLGVFAMLSPLLLFFYSLSVLGFAWSLVAAIVVMRTPSG